MPKNDLLKTLRTLKFCACMLVKTIPTLSCYLFINFTFANRDKDFPISHYILISIKILYTPIEISDKPFLFTSTYQLQPVPCKNEAYVTMKYYFT
jgi:hypothetical protein